ncbi:UTP--glucose-1-phosphate uridylyltransferase [Limibaculum sp. M0105]|uniref:UTP--glucose-1-phosphate uridylyltransferase n=1 Tax=Thermohalobaculum xanthum TaxID=2753746 RepID=A0A8J7M5D8_9RHOB|nr:UTP--glucose-1-phosphate uridylyltransferase [Thermohalobaculum xanthum]MBK0398092.1 UTP--glucose-1-phosphate uridylyltransferase [Thermohalobaculum xanthum]
MTRRVRTAVFPVAGLGTRFLPATKSMPKEMLPLVDRPLIQYAIDEAREAGIEDFIFVTARGKSALEDYFDAAPSLQRTLSAGGKTDLLAEVERATMPSGAIAYIRQQEALGLGHAVWCARRLIGDQPFAVILPDDVITGAARGCLAQMVEAYEARGRGGCMVAAVDVSPEQVSSYGILDVASDDGRIVEARGMIEKPKPADAPSRVAVIGRYILSPAVMESLEARKRGAGGEIQLTDAIAEQIGAPGGVSGFRFEGTRYDCGSKSGFLQATVAFALARPDLGPGFARYIRSVAADLEGS